MIFLYLNIKETFLHSEKVFISIEIVFIQRNVFYPKKMMILKKIGTFRENVNFKLSIIAGFVIYIWYPQRKLKQWLKASWFDSTIVAWNERPSERSTVIFFVGLNRIAEKLQNTQQKYTIT